MMYLRREDFYSKITEQHLAQVIRNDDGTLHRAESEAIELVYASLSKRYDVDALFAKAERSPLLISILVRLTLYHLFEAVAPDRITQVRGVAYEEATKQLKMLEKGELAPNWPRLQDGSEVKADISLHSPKKRPNHF